MPRGGTLQLKYLGVGGDELARWFAVWEFEWEIYFGVLKKFDLDDGSRVGKMIFIDN